MPDLRPVRRQDKKIRGVERRITKDTIRELETTRTALHTLIIENGHSSAAVLPRIRGEIAQLDQRLQGHGKVYGKQVDDAVLDGADRLGKIVEAANLPTYDVAQVDALSAAGRSATRALLLEDRPAWLDALEVNLIAAYNKLRIEGAEADMIAARLLAPDLQKTGRASVWRHGKNKAITDTVGAVWTLSNLLNTQTYQAIAQITGTTYQRQAIAAIDHLTTDCCLHVHGQIVAFDQPFKLTGTPRYADEVMTAPFHWNCRTSVTLYHGSFESMGISTAEMVAAARAEISARLATGKRSVIHPSHSTSGRD